MQIDNFTLTYIHEVISGKRLQTGKWDGGVPLKLVACVVYLIWILASFSLGKIVLIYGNMDTKLLNIICIILHGVAMVVVLYYICRYVVMSIKAKQNKENPRLQKFNEELLALHLMEVKSERYENVEILSVTRVMHPHFEVELIKLEVILENTPRNLFVTPYRDLVQGIEDSFFTQVDVHDEYVDMYKIAKKL